MGLKRNVRLEFPVPASLPAQHLAFVLARDTLIVRFLATRCCFQKIPEIRR